MNSKFDAILQPVLTPSRKKNPILVALAVTFLSPIRIVPVEAQISQGQLRIRYFLTYGNILISECHPSALLAAFTSFNSESASTGRSGRILNLRGVHGIPEVEMS